MQAASWLAALVLLTTTATAASHVAGNPYSIAISGARLEANVQPFGPLNAPLRHVLGSLGLAVRSDRANKLGR